jgi:ribosomal protein S12 methylthiotransferase
MNTKERVHVLTLGCSKNVVDSERLMKQISANNFKLTDDPNNADTLIINTCGFIEAAKQESINTILDAVEMKKKGGLKKIIVSGCLSERYKKELINDIPEVDVYFGTENYEGIVNELGGELKKELLGERIITTPSHTAYLKISEGCDNPCSFCSIPLIRGAHKSKTIEELVSEAEFLARNNTKELVIIGQDTTDYGKDIYGKRVLADLLNRLSRIDGIEWIRLMYAYPSHFPDDLIDVIANNPKVCKYIDMPLQHISDDVLKSMRRGITARRTKELINKLRERIPGLVLRTTLITGYPNETEKDFEELCDFIKEFKFERLGVFTFSVEERTSSFILGDPVSEETKESRKAALMNIQKDISAGTNSNLIDTTVKVLVDRIEGEYYIGRTYRDAPEVDGEVLIALKDGEAEIGSFTDAVVYDYDEYDLYAKFS